MIIFIIKSKTAEKTLTEGSSDNVFATKQRSDAGALIFRSDKETEAMPVESICRERNEKGCREFLDSMQNR